jgi:hypothetical protein
LFGGGGVGREENGECVVSLDATYRVGSACLLR